MTAAIETHGLTKTFPGNVAALRGLDMTVPAGAVYGLIGRNGAGKTTALRIAMGLLQPSSGTAHVLGVRMDRARATQRARTVYVPQASQFPPGMTLAQLCRYYSYFFPTWDTAAAQRIAHRFELPTDRPVSHLSGGEQRKAHIVLAFAARTQVLILDEPAAGLDPAARRQFIDEIIQLVSDDETDAASVASEARRSVSPCARISRTVLLSTHIIADLERLADHVGVMHKGQMLREARLEDLQSRVRRVQIIFADAGPPPGFHIPGVLRQQQEGPVLTALVELQDESALDALRHDESLRVTEFPVPLEDLLIDLTGPTDSQDSDIPDRVPSSKEAIS